MALIRNRTAGADLACSAGMATGLWSRFRGLMLRKRLDEGSGLVIEPCGSIHMMFMRFRIDAVFYDRDRRVTKVSRDLRPWTGLAFAGKDTRGVIELAAGAANATKPGDLLEFIP